MEISPRWRGPSTCDGECAPFYRTQRGVKCGCSEPTPVPRTNPTTGKTWAESAEYLCGIHPSCSCRGEVLFKQLPFPALFLEGWPVTQNTIHSFLLHPPPSFLIAGHRAAHGCESRNVISTPLSHHRLPFLVSSPFPLPSPPSRPVPPIYRGDRVIRVWALVSYSIHFYLRFPGLILQSDILLSQSTFPPHPHPALVVFEGGKKKPIGFFVTSIECLCPRRPPAPSPHIWITHLHFGLVIWLQQ